MVHPEDATLTPLPYVFQLLRSPHVSAAVVKVIMSIIDNLLSDQEDEDMDTEEVGSVEPGTLVAFPDANLSEWTQ